MTSKENEDDKILQQAFTSYVENNYQRIESKVNSTYEKLKTKNLSDLKWKDFKYDRAYSPAYLDLDYNYDETEFMHPALCYSLANMGKWVTNDPHNVFQKATLLRDFYEAFVISEQSYYQGHPENYKFLLNLYARLVNTCKQYTGVKNDFREQFSILEQILRNRFDSLNGNYDNFTSAYRDRNEKIENNSKIIKGIDWSKTKAPSGKLVYDVMFGPGGYFYENKGEIYLIDGNGVSDKSLTYNAVYKDSNGRNLMYYEICDVWVNQYKIRKLKVNQFKSEKEMFEAIEKAF